MKNRYQIGIIGNKETILGFKALGLKTIFANTTEEAVQALYNLKAEESADEDGGVRPSYAIIFITEELSMNITKEDYQKLSKGALPAIIPVPGIKGTTGYGIRRIGKMVEQAVGSDIFKE
jgi:V/A-type H+/Na+-transporting ATPase subunit F